MNEGHDLQCFSQTMPKGKIEKGSIQQASGLSYTFCSDTGFLTQVSFTHQEVFFTRWEAFLLNATFYTSISITDWEFMF